MIYVYNNNIINVFYFEEDHFTVYFMNKLNEPINNIINISYSER